MSTSTESATRAAPLVLALDTGSPVTSVAVARGERVLAEIVCPTGVRGAGSWPMGVVGEGGWPMGVSGGGGGERPGSSATVVALIDAALARAGATPRALDAVCVLRGPGSFTGLRIGLATALGLREALGLRAAAMPTLRVLAEAAGADRVLAVVDALRGEWFVQAFRPVSGENPDRVRARSLEAAGPAELVRPEALRARPPVVVCGFGADRLAEEAGLEATGVVVPAALAGVAARLASRWPEWDPAHLTEPLYLRPAPTTPPRRPTAIRDRERKEP